MDLTDQTIVITGSEGSVGTALIEGLSSLCRIVYAIDRTEQQPVSKSIANVRFKQCDLLDPQQVTDTFGAIAEETDAISVLINNAGVIHSELVYDLTRGEDKCHSFSTWDTVIRSNLYSAFHASNAVIPYMVARRTKGLIINVSSIAAHGNVGQSAYSAAKAGINGLTVSLSKELGVFGIRVNSIAPGFIDTASTQAALDAKQISRWRQQVPLNRLGTSSELVLTMHHVIANDYLNGQVIELNGGLRI